MINTIWDISNEDFIEYVSSCNTYSDVLRKCGYTNLGNSKTIKKRIKLLNLSTKHFVKYKIPKKEKTPIEKIFIIIILTLKKYYIVNLSGNINVKIVESMNIIINQYL
jgi:hypothetical protein